MSAQILAFFFCCTLATCAAAAEENPPDQNLLIIGASSLSGLDHSLGAMLESRGIHMNIEFEWPRLDQVGDLLKSKPAWD